MEELAVLTRQNCKAYDLGIIDYKSGLELQRKLVETRSKDAIGDLVLVVQHPHVFTIGKSGGEHHIVASKEIVNAKNISIFYSDRGGNITYHGPGQLVCYPILNLQEKGMDIIQYVRSLEEVIIGTLDRFSVAADRKPGYPGVWVRQEKIGAIGIRVTDWVTSHGFSLNINNDLDYFSYINPCGIVNAAVTSLSKVLGREVEIEKAIPVMLQSFSHVFNVRLIAESQSSLCEYLL